MNKEVNKTFDYFINEAESDDLKEIIRNIKIMYNEIERLNNIINELEKWLLKEYMSGNYEELYRMGIQDSYNKLQELKGSDKE